MRAHGYFAHFTGILFVFHSFLLNAAPLIEVDKTVYDCGVLTEGKNEIATAFFNVLNRGDSLLKIENVRPGCGCVVAAYDTFIPPGKSGRIKVEARLNGYRGDIRKSVTLTSNAQNQPLLRLMLQATIQPVIAVSKQHIILSLSKDQKPDSLYLCSLKKDLKVTGVTFETSEQSNSGWLNQMPMPITYEWNRTDSIRPDGLNVFMLLIKHPDLKESVSGEFKISTNHPDKKQLQISGRIEK